MVQCVIDCGLMGIVDVDWFGGVGGDEFQVDFVFGQQQ